MSNIAHIGRKMTSFNSAPEFDGYTRVVIMVSEDLEYAAGEETGRTLTLECPWGTQKMADNLLASIRGFKYQPYTAHGAILDPAAELGDGLTANNVYCGIYSLTTRFGSLCRTEVSAPAEEELDHEYPYIPKQERKVTRRLRTLSTELKVQAGLISAEIAERKSDVESINTNLTVQSGQIAAKVSKTGGSASSFGWVLDDTSWTIRANNRDVLKATEKGLEVYGTIKATSGDIGGFEIKSNHLSYNKQTWGGTNSKGIYIGPSGIQLGKNFKVDSAGNLTAASGTFTGSVNAGSIRYGDDYGTLSGKGISSKSLSGSKISNGTLTTANMIDGINASLGYADFANGVFNGWNKANNIWAGQLKITGTVELWNQKIGMKTAAVATPGGGSTTIYYLGYD